MASIEVYPWCETQGLAAAMQDLELATSFIEYFDHFIRDGEQTGAMRRRLRRAAAKSNLKAPYLESFHDYAQIWVRLLATPWDRRNLFSELGRNISAPIRILIPQWFYGWVKENYGALLPELKQ